jgi:hypothetical protein
MQGGCICSADGEEKEGSGGDREVGGGDRGHGVCHGQHQAFCTTDSTAWATWFFWLAEC